MADDSKPQRVQGSRPDRVRLVVLVYRKQGMSIEDFQTAWRDDFAPIFSQLAIVKKNLLTYEQCHVNGSALERFKKAGIPIEDCDGIAVYEAMSYEKLFECLEDEDFVKAVGPEEERLLDGKRSLAFPVDIVSIFDDPT